MDYTRPDLTKVAAYLTLRRNLSRFIASDTNVRRHPDRSGITIWTTVLTEGEGDPFRVEVIDTRKFSGRRKLGDCIALEAKVENPQAFVEAAIAWATYFEQRDGMHAIIGRWRGQLDAAHRRRVDALLELASPKREVNIFELRLADKRARREKLRDAG